VHVGRGHTLRQRRVAARERVDRVGHLLLGELIEFGSTSKMFTSPNDKRTQDYITGRFG